MRLVPLAFALVGLAPMISAGDRDDHCPLYPAARRVEDKRTIARELEFHRFSAGAGKAKAHRANPVNLANVNLASANFIDDYIFGKIGNDGVPVADRTTDQEFLRRITLDLTGHIPTAGQVTAFQSDPDPNKREALIDALLGSPEYVDRWTQWFGDQYKVGSNYYNFVSITSRNLFYRYVRDMVERDRPYNEFVSQMISATGDSLTNAAANYLVRGFQTGDPIQDTYDALTNNITTQFLGVQTQCVSCHDGRRHLEPINLFLLGKRRADFWRQSAFLSKLTVVQESVTPYGSSNHLIFSENTAGSYLSTVPSNNPGQRPPRTGGPYRPTYMFTGIAASSKDWRAELAATVTGDRQFARATVNYLWARLFTMGIVDPPDSWDLARIDPKSAPAPETGFGLQPSHPELIEALATEFKRLQHPAHDPADDDIQRLPAFQPSAGWVEATL
jgi:hypothetical protein